jgi:hypothetical protein
LQTVRFEKPTGLTASRDSPMDHAERLIADRVEKENYAATKERIAVIRSNYEESNTALILEVAAAETGIGAIMAGFTAASCLVRGLSGITASNAHNTHQSLADESLPSRLPP